MKNIAGTALQAVAGLTLIGAAAALIATRTTSAGTCACAACDLSRLGVCYVFYVG